jgi:TRAP-type C4-dicarboxylate transport system permease small subunit
MVIIEKKYKKRYRIVRDVLLIVLAFFFIIVGFLFASVRIDYDLQFQNIRYGLMAFALIISGTGLIVSVYRKSRK